MLSYALAIMPRKKKKKLSPLKKRKEKDIKLQNVFSCQILYPVLEDAELDASGNPELGQRFYQHS